MLRVRPATKDDFVRGMGRAPEGTWFAMVAVDEDDVPAAFGTVSWDEWGRAWGAFDALRPIPALVMHRTAVTVMRWAKNVGEPSIFVVCDEQIQGARHWLQRLGFEARDQGVWIKCLASKQP